MLLADRLSVPDDTQALLLDLDGVILDTFNFEARLVGDLLRARVPEAPPVPDALFRSAFALPITAFWRRLLQELSLPAGDELVDSLTADLEAVRTGGHPDVLPGVPELIDAASGRLAVAVVSNNPRAHVQELLRAAGLDGERLEVTGNDEGFPSKPAPDMYLEAARRLGAEPQRCSVVEDSLIGGRSARVAGMFVVGVATGPCTFEELAASGDFDVVHRSFELPEVAFEPGDVTDKRIDTPNEFVSHMVEHIAWRSGCTVALTWHSDDWRALGRRIGAAYGALVDGDGIAQAIGLIDDGSARVSVRRSGTPRASFGDGSGELDWFLGLRVEQLSSGHGLVRLLEGLAEGAGLQIGVDVVSVEDAHHTWEAIFRAVGVCLRDLSSTLTAHAESAPPPRAAASGLGIEVEQASSRRAVVVRRTAESECRVGLDLDRDGWSTQIETSDSVHMEGLPELIDALASAAAAGGSVSFRATELSSSHVVAEDIGMTLGEAFRALATAKMEADGLEGFGFGRVSDDLPEVALSWEGRKFLKIVAVGWPERELKRLRVGSTLASGLFSEDLDDFLDGFAGGMRASVMIHWPPTSELDESWRAVFTGLGLALAGALRTNRPRRGLIAGVKATLA